MNISLYLLAGLLLSLPLAWRAHKGLQILLVAYWAVILLWSLQIIHPFIFAPMVWSSFLHIDFSYQMDGLARLFALLISGIGILIFIYAAIYAQGYPKKQTKLLSLLQVFAVSMLGIVLTDSTILLFVAWELTTVTSYLLIQFDVTDKKANQAAFNGMFISVLGGLAMLAGFILLQQQTHNWSIQSALQLSQHTPYLLPAFGLILLGAVTKSAQFPFYFWLPGAMKAPTPVSAYLHSATMVNAGIYLLARFHPLFVSLPVWSAALTFFGMSTMIVAGVLSVFQRDLKAILAYTTLFALGSMVYLLASDHWLSAEALSLFLIFHGLYKAAAFMWVGTIDKTYGTRDLIALRGLGKRWPLASIVALISLSAMAGLPPFFGFVVKEILYEAKLAKGSISYSLMTVGILSSMLISAASIKCLYYWFTGQPNVKKQKTLAFGLLCPTLLVVSILALNGIAPFLAPIIQEAANSVIWQPDKFEPLYSGLSTVLSLLTVVGGALLFLLCQWINRYQLSWPKWLNPLILFEQGLAKFLYFGRWFTYITQRQPLGKQLILILSTLMLWLGWAFYVSWPTWPELKWQSVSWWVDALSVLLALAGMSLLASSRFLINMISLAVFGLIMSGIFVLQGAPDVAMTQLLVEILTVVILVIALRKATLSHSSLTLKQKMLHGLIALLIGSAITLLLFFVTSVPFNWQLSEYFIHNSLPLAHGKNVVNVILVDFRAFDTFGEALVILATALAIWLLIDKSLIPKRIKKDSV